MNQLALDFPKHKNGNGGHRPGHKQFSDDLRRLINDLRAAEELRAAELKRTAGVAGRRVRRCASSWGDGWPALCVLCSLRSAK